MNEKYTNTKILNYQKLLQAPYFKKTRYYCIFKESLKREPTEKECKCAFDTLNVLIRLHNEWASNRHTNIQRFYVMKETLENHLTLYNPDKNDYIDEFIEALLESYKAWLKEMKEIEEKYLGEEKKDRMLCKNIRKEIEEYLEQLNEVKFDYLHNDYCYYRKTTGNKGHHSYISKLDYSNDLDDFIKNYNKVHRFEMLTNDTFSEEIIYIRKLYSNMGKLSVYLSNENYKDAHKIILETLTCERPNVLKSFFYDMLKIFERIGICISNEEYELAYKEFEIFYKTNENWFIIIS